MSGAINMVKNYQVNEDGTYHVGLVDLTKDKYNEVINYWNFLYAGKSTKYHIDNIE